MERRTSFTVPAKLISSGTVLVLSLVACGTPAETTVTEQWEFGGEVPPSISVPLPLAGVVVNSLVTPDRSVVMLAYPVRRLAELVRFYDDRLIDPDTARSEYAVIAETQAVWTVRWITADLEVRVLECIDASTRDFSQACVAVEQRPG
jgi:hypothetical protein